MTTHDSDPIDEVGNGRRRGVSRRSFLGQSAAASAGVVVAAPALAHASPEQERHGRQSGLGDPGGDLPVDGADPGELAQQSSTFFATAFVEHAGTLAAAGSDGDLWPNCWADDDHVYAANGDGRGFSDQPYKDVVVNRIVGHPETGLTGEKLAESDHVANVWADPSKYNRKPTGMVCVGGVLYLAVQDLRFADTAFDDVPNASISRSDDHGVTWQKTTTPMFTDYRFTTIFFADFGKNSQNAVRALGDRDGAYVYAYGMDWNWRACNAGIVPDPVDLYLARVPADAVQDRRQWQFFTGTDGGGAPTWSRAIEDKVPVLHDPLRRYADTRPGQGGNLTVISQGGVLYNRALDRYIYTSWTDPSFEFYEAPRPWGPWKRFLYHNAGLTPWYRMSDKTHTPKNGGYGTTLPSKYVSADGRDLWMQSNWWNAPVPTPQDNYNFNLRKVRLTPYRPTEAANRADARDNLARTGADATPLQVSAHYANWRYYSDGNRSKSEDSFDGTNKTVDYWGYTFSHAYRIDRLEYTTGIMPEDGGWFSAYAGGLRVQVRQNFRWIDVERLQITPDYPHNRSAGPNKTYTMRFTSTWGDGVRIVGQPGGSAHFTSIAELEVYYDG
jgi:hypothetical protein